MESPEPGARPIGWTELIAASVALLVAVAATWSMAVVLANAPRLAQAAPPDNQPGPANPATTRCAAPPLGGIRLGTARAYGGAGGLRLDPVPVAAAPPVTAQAAYAAAVLKPPVCETELLLAYYSGANPPADHLLAWVVVSTAPCGSDRCTYISPVDATTGAALRPSWFSVTPG